MQRALVELAYRLSGLIAVILALRMTPELVSAIAWDFTGPDGSPFDRSTIIVGHMVPIVALLLGGIFLILCGSKLAPSFSTSDPGVASSATPADIHTILLSTTGVVLLGLALSTVPSIVHNLVILYSDFVQGFAPEQRPLASVTWLRLGGVLLQAACGVCLILWSSSFVVLLRHRFDKAPVIVADGRCPHCGYWYETREYKSEAMAYLCGNCRQELPREEVVRRLTTG